MSANPQHVLLTLSVLQQSGDVKNTVERVVHNISKIVSTISFFFFYVFNIDIFY
jgi:hypothetical protein